MSSLMNSLETIAPTRFDRFLERAELLLGHALSADEIDAAMNAFVEGAAAEELALRLADQVRA
jgi:hypothetical protein